MKPVKITGRNVMFTEPMDHYSLNLGLILGKYRNYIIDTGLGSGSVQPILDYLGGDKKPTVVVNTHWHFDHIMGNFIFEGGLIISHPLCRALIAKLWDGSADELKPDGETRLCLPNLTFDSELCFPDDGIKMFFTPGHSVDGISVYDEHDKVLYAGDSIGDTPEEIVPHIDTDPETLRRMITTYEKYDFDVCISGHNSPQGADVLARMTAALDQSWKKQLEQFGPPKTFMP